MMIDVSQTKLATLSEGPKSDVDRKVLIAGLGRCSTTARPGRIVLEEP